MKIRPIPGVDDYGVNEIGEVWRIRGAPRRATPRKSRCGYIRVWLCQNGKQRVFSVHRLVLLAFVGEPPTDQHEAAHWDGDRTNNHVSNLRWATLKENADDKRRHGTMVRGEKINFAVLSRGDIEWIRAYPKRRGMFMAMARRLQVDRGTIERAYHGKSWAWL